MNKKVMIYAYTNFNLGDDLFIKILCERYPNTQFLLYAPKKYKRLFKNIKNLEVYSSNTFIVRGTNYIFKLLKAKTPYLRRKIAENCDAAVYIGGSLFMQNGNWKKKYVNKSNMYIENQPFYLLGANFGPFHDQEFYSTYKNLFSKYTDICFRDSYSYELFSELSNVRMADDIVFQLNRDIKIKEENKNNVVISVIKPSVREHLLNYDEIYYRKIMEIIIYLNNKGYTTTLMSFCENEGDEEAVEKIIQLLPEEYARKVKKYFYRSDIDSALKVIATSSFVIATRFHSMILGWLFNKPVLPIVYSEKMTNVMKDVGFKGYYIELKKVNQLEVVEVFNSIKANYIDVTKQIEKSEKHFEELDKFLMDRS